MLQNETYPSLQLFGLTFTHNSSGRPAARIAGKEKAGTPRAPAEDFVPCTLDLGVGVSSGA